MLSTEPHCTYEVNPLAEVICQLRFPEILSISENAPAAFQEQIRAEFPQYDRHVKKLPPNIMGKTVNFSDPNAPTVVNHQFTSADGNWYINLTSRFVSLSCKNYTCWEDFAAKLDAPLAAFIQAYQPAYFERIGLRYLNFISRYALGLADVPFRELIQPCYLGILAEDDVMEASAGQSTTDAELALRGGCRVKLHAGPGMVKRNGKTDPETKFVFDQDLSISGQLPINLSAGALQTLHAQAFSIFRGAITEKLHDALTPHFD